MSTLSIAARFRGPPSSGNGGYSAGALATLLEGPAEVTLRAPPPLDRALQVERDQQRLLLRDGETLIADAQPCDVVLQLPPAVSYEAAQRASETFVGFAHHPYPSCFVCGPARSENDGLRLFPGAVPGTQQAAAPWLPDRSLCDDTGLVDARFVWAALDCPSWWGYAAFHAQELPILLGRIAARVLARPRCNERCVVQGWALSREGRRIVCGSALFGESGDAYAYARATWIEVKA